MSSNDTGSEKQKHKPNAPEICSESLMNLTLIDPPRWGWTALGGVADLLTPHEVSGVEAEEFQTESGLRITSILSFYHCSAPGEGVRALRIESREDEDQPRKFQIALE